MPARKAPTERQRRLGAELRKMRERAGLSMPEAAKLHNTDRTTISNVESGRFGISQDRVRVWSSNYSCDDQLCVDVLAAMARQRRVGAKQWWDDYRDAVAPEALDLAEMEHYATALVGAQITHMPGVLQREDYVRAVFDEAVPALEPDDLERKVAFRVARQQLLDRAQPPEFSFVVHEAALRIQFGGRKVSRTQLDHLLKQSERENVVLLVLPFTAGGFPSSAGSTLYAHAPAPQLDTVQKDTPQGSTFLHAERDLANYRLLLDRLEQRALGPSDSQDLIRTVTREL